MTIYKNMIQLMNDFLAAPIQTDTTEKFCNQYMDMFYDHSNKLENEVSSQCFDIFDDINWLCDSYEPEQSIQNSDPYCIDEMELRDKLTAFVNQLKEHGLYV